MDLLAIVIGQLWWLKTLACSSIALLMPRWFDSNTAVIIEQITETKLEFPRDSVLACRMPFDTHR